MKILNAIILYWQCQYIAMAWGLSKAESINQEHILVGEVLAHAPIKKCDCVVVSPSSFQGITMLNLFPIFQMYSHMVFRHW